jgi:hypothetical protein
MEESFEKPNGVNKKLPLEELDRDELLKRCKNYLALAQKAKQARDGKLLARQCDQSKNISLNMG